jgi:CMP-N-acetylneuraminic acid synthetase
VNVLAVIPAKGASSRVSGKNLRPLGGKPLVAWTIDAALEARSITRVVVSTDSDAVAEVARGRGVDVLCRPAPLAADGVEVAGVVTHALDELAADGYVPDVVVLLQPTSPFRDGLVVDECVALHLAFGKTVATAREGWEFTDAAPGVVKRPHPNGACWVVAREVFRRTGYFRAEELYVLDAVSGIDIDWPHEFAAAEWVAAPVGVA